MRLFLAALFALALAFSPASTSEANAAPAAMADCSMDGHMPAEPADHSKMDCCTPVCQISAAAALLPDRAGNATPFKTSGALHDRAAVKELASVTASSLDPPPRLPA